VRCLQDGAQWTAQDEQTLRQQTERANKALESLNDVLKDGH